MRFFFRRATSAGFPPSTARAYCRSALSIMPSTEKFQTPMAKRQKKIGN
jgi:hypothetical protein